MRRAKASRGKIAGECICFFSFSHAAASAENYSWGTYREAEGGSTVVVKKIMRIF
jgi:hypothetical protein